MSQSKPEYETQVGAQGTTDLILRGLGLTQLVALEKRCRNFALEFESRQVLATLVRVPELEEIFLEVEALVDDEGDVDSSLRIVRNLLAELEIGEGRHYDRDVYQLGAAEARNAEALTNSRSSGPPEGG